MPGNRDCTVYVAVVPFSIAAMLLSTSLRSYLRYQFGVLYEILIQAGRVIDLYIPCDKETNRRKGFAFAEYENEESAHYAVRLFTGLVTLYNRTLRLAISGQGKPPQNSGGSMLLASNTLPKPKSQPKKIENSKITQQPVQLLTSSRISAYSESPSSRFPEHPYSVSPHYSQASPPGLVGNGYGYDFKGNSFDYDKRTSQSALDNRGRFDAHLSRPVSNSRDSVSYSLDGIRNEAYLGRGMAVNKLIRAKLGFSCLKPNPNIELWAKII
ncbi:hypothetical protein ACLOJK_014166 [Asimina triloba]